MNVINDTVHSLKVQMGYCDVRREQLEVDYFNCSSSVERKKIDGLIAKVNSQKAMLREELDKYIKQLKD